MISNLFVSASVISALSLLWRIFMKEPLVEKYIENLPYLLSKPLTCGVCRTFWMTFISMFIFVPFNSTMFQLQFSGILAEVIYFIMSWMVTGMTSVMIFYAFLTFYEGSHYLAHKAEKMHQ